jgi:hypothetical protein
MPPPLVKPFLELWEEQKNDPKEHNQTARGARRRRHKGACRAAVSKSGASRSAESYKPSLKFAEIGNLYFSTVLVSHGEAEGGSQRAPAELQLSAIRAPSERHPSASRAPVSGKAEPLPSSYPCAVAGPTGTGPFVLRLLHKQINKPSIKMVGLHPKN